MKDEYSKKSSKIRELMTLNPTQLADHFTRNDHGIENVAPNLAPPMMSTAMNGLNYLHQKMPAPTMEFMGKDQWEPSSVQKRQWLEHYETVNDPVKVLDHVKNGKLTSNHMEAMQSVYPELLQEMQEKVSENMTPKNMKNLHYASKISLSKFLGKPLDGSLVSNVVLADQMQFNQQTPQASASGPKRKNSTLGGLEKLNQSKLVETETNKEETDV